jgi:hypothetical protein
MKKLKNSTSEGFKVDMKSASKMMSELTEEDWQKAIDARDAEGFKRYRRIMNINSDTPQFKWFDWEGRPAVIVEYKDGSAAGFLVKDGDEPGKWTAASGFEIYDSGREISKADFLEVFKDRLN